MNLFITLCYIILYYIILYCIILYYIILYYIILYYILLYYIVFYCIVLYWIVFYCIALHCIVILWYNYVLNVLVLFYISFLYCLNLSLFPLKKNDAAVVRKESGGQDVVEKSLPRPPSGSIPQSFSQTSLSSLDSVSSDASKAEGQSQQSRPKEKTKVKKDRMPKVTLQNVSTKEDVAVCLFDTFKGVKITFKFGIHDDEPEEVAEKMVSMTLLLGQVLLHHFLVFSVRKMRFHLESVNYSTEDRSASFSL